MKSILLFYKLLFFKPLYIVSNVFLSLSFLISTPLQLAFPEHIIILRIFVFGSISLLIFINLSRYIWFISKYKKEALNLSNEKLKEKYPQLLRIEKNLPLYATPVLNYEFWLRTRLPFIASEFNEQDPDYEEKQKFLYKMHLRLYIVESFLVVIVIACLTLSFYFIFAWTFSVTPRTNNFSVNYSLIYSIVTSVVLYILGMFAIVWINLSKTKIIQISKNLLSISVEECKKAYKSTFFRFYIPKKN
ncbi:hypothetical protein Q4497_01650 [Mesomycoplasma ovipneumoniae]|uniref:Uncharacterized protein n=1 Tax=Mesomycoplasma ovipneumoniae TaxID=29562 RepID=A0AAW6Q8A0_9BACT|nr:hypothetical protein [Mesomycoplasma ovipneumoniae]MDF9627598.1 hypothetical protein [Mesomycoplasma ovipneumoniae]MDO4157674.1 hypothetical protein [Mesomycoplasma ovipneumoniae]MDO4158375.1 hypothetical protein [Mesomycoplasma ovipneumoniae]MDO6821730.1 hypothetical protein [Mesomycoplasma ovipneumoniae]MDO6855462.1 hypothetical protein [Mesomycoplasma ovipneumoniae]